MNNPASIPAPPILEGPTLDQLCDQLALAKFALKAAQQTVLDAETAVIKAVGTKEEGSFTATCDRYKVTTNQPVRRTVDRDTAVSLSRALPEELYQAIFDFKPSLNVRLFKDLEISNPDAFSLVAKAVTSKPGKAAVKLEEL